MNKEKYSEPNCTELEIVWRTALCQSGGTEDFGTDDDLIYPVDSWK